jgi:hypothetical protein
LTPNEIPRERIAAVRAAANILDVAQRRIGGEFKRQGREHTGRCPFHDDGAPSLRINPAKDGGVWTCDPCKARGLDHGGDVIRLVMKIDGIKFREAVEKLAAEYGVSLTADTAQASTTTTTTTEARTVATYRYADAAGVVVGINRRREWIEGGEQRKAFAWTSADGATGMPEACKTLLYRAPDVAAAIVARKPVLVVEGEKAADAVVAAGLCATTNANGAGKWLPEHAAALRGGDVVILGDNDVAGRTHAAAVVASLAGVARVVLQLDLPGLPAKGDAFDYLAANPPHTLGSLVDDAVRVAHVDQARADLLANGWGAADRERGSRSELDRLDSASDLFSRAFPSTPWLLQGLVTENAVACIGGEPKTTKTWCGLDMLMSIATRTPAFGEFKAVGPARGVALYLVEDSAQSTRNRLRSLAHARALSPEDACRLMFVRNRVQLDLRNLDDMARIVASVRRLPVPVAAIMLDPLRDIIGDTDENSASEMSAVTHALRVVREVLGVAVVFVHHAAKQGADSRGRRGGQKLRGSSALHGAVDCGLYLSDLKTNGANQWSNRAEVEVKAARARGGFLLTLDVRDDSDENGEAIEAKWTVSTEAKPATDPITIAADLRRVVLNALGERADERLSAAGIDKKIGKKNGTSSPVLAELAGEGRATWLERQETTATGKRRKVGGWFRSPLPAAEQTDLTFPLPGHSPALKGGEGGRASVLPSPVGGGETVGDGESEAFDQWAGDAANDDREAA